MSSEFISRNVSSFILPQTVHDYWEFINVVNTKRKNSFRSTAISKQRVLAAAPPERNESDAEYECDVDDYHPTQPLVNDHGVSFVCLSSPHTKIDQHVMQVIKLYIFQEKICHLI